MKELSRHIGSLLPPRRRPGIRPLTPRYRRHQHRCSRWRYRSRRTRDWIHVRSLQGCPQRVGRNPHRYVPPRRLQPAFSKLTAFRALAGKGYDFGGSKIRPEATGYGLVYYVGHMIQEARGEDFNGKLVAISGAGNVAQVCPWPFRDNRRTGADSSTMNCSTPRSRSSSLEEPFSPSPTPRVLSSPLAARDSLPRSSPRLLSSSSREATSPTSVTFLASSGWLVRSFPL